MIDAESVRYQIKNRGTEVTFQRVTGQSASDYDPASGSTTGSSSNDDETVKVAFVNYREREVDGTNVQRGDRKALMSAFQTNGNALTKEPQTDDKFVGEGSTVSIVSARTLKDAGTVVAYVCQVRE